MTNFEVVKSFQASDYLNEKVPDLFFGEFSISFLVIVDEHEQITTVRILHDNAEAVGAFLKECFFITNDIWMVN